MTKTQAAILGALHSLCGDERFEYRTVSSVLNAIPANFNVPVIDILDLVQQYPETFVIKTRRADGMRLVGLNTSHSADKLYHRALGAVLTALSDGRYELRSLLSIAAAVDTHPTYLAELVSELPHLFHTKTRRRDGATLVGLVA